MNKEELLAKKQAGTETFEVHWQYCENNEQKGNTISFDYDRKTIAIGTMMVKFSELTEYEYLHTYTWCNDHPQDPETRIHDDKYMEYANVINRESKILWNETSDNDAQDERDEDEDGYVYESYWHVERLTLKAAHKENTDMFSWFRFFRRGQNGSNVEIKFSSPGVAKLRNRLRLIFINLMAK